MTQAKIVREPPSDAPIFRIFPDFKHVSHNRILSCRQNASGMMTTGMAVIMAGTAGAAAAFMVMPFSAAMLPAASCLSMHLIMMSTGNIRIVLKSTV